MLSEVPQVGGRQRTVLKNELFLLLSVSLLPADDLTALGSPFTPLRFAPLCY